MPSDYLSERRGIKIEVDFLVMKDQDAEKVAEAVFNILAGWEDAPYESVDGYDVTDDGLDE